MKEINKILYNEITKYPVACYKFCARFNISEQSFPYSSLIDFIENDLISILGYFVIFAIENHVQFEYQHGIITINKQSYPTLNPLKPFIYLIFETFKKIDNDYTNTSSRGNNN